MFLFAVTLFGLLLGSFISMLSWRLPRIMELDGRAQLKAISLGGSKCPHCQTNIPWTRLIPLVSWLIAKGRCHACQAPISARYPLIEFSSASLVFLSFFLLGNSLEAWLIAGFALWLLTLSIIDFEHKLILDNLSLPLLWLGLLVNGFGVFTSAQDAILGAAVGYLSLWTIYQIHFQLTKREGMGYGDFKLTAALGAWLGLMALPQIIVIAAVSSLVIALILLVLKKQYWQQQMAFGPFLALGGLSSLILNQLGIGLY
jgi:leader peptidase (prepilin peptidase) / N-methyltransferase